jgi:hypothetical protein
MTRRRPTATRHFCPLGISVHCDKGAGTSPRQKCRHCGARLATARGLYGVFVWRGDGHYRPADALATFTREGAAERFASADERRVVRWCAQR